jgi:hypothetical protein
MFRSFWFVGCAVLGLSLCAVARQAKASAVACAEQMKAKAYAQAASCYELAAQQVDQDPSQKAFATLLKERYLRYSALAYQRAAEGAQEAPKAFFLERAVEMLTITFREGYCRAARRCRQNRLLADQMKAQIRYGTLVISSKDPKARIVVKGFRYTQAREKDFTEEVRPGAYQITIRFADTPVQTREVVVPPGDRVLLDVSPTQIKIKVRRVYASRQLPPLILASYIGGVLVIVGGGALGVVGLVRQNEVNARMGDPKQNIAYTDKQFSGDLGAAQIMTVIGMSALGLGIAIVVAGVVAQQTLSPKKNAAENRPKIAEHTRNVLEKAETVGAPRRLGEHSRVLFVAF